METENKGGMTRKQKETQIKEALHELSADVLDLIYRIVFYAESGLE